jgi:hypothetical protein
MPDADPPGDVDGVLQFATGEAGTDCRYGKGPIPAGEAGRHRHDRAVHASGIRHGDAASSAEDVEQGIAFLDEGHKHLRRQTVEWNPRGEVLCLRITFPQGGSHWWDQECVPACVHQTRGQPKIRMPLSPDWLATFRG